MPIDPKRDIRAGTPQELEAYRRQTGGGGDHKPPSIRERFKEMVDNWSLPLRNEAKRILRPVMNQNPQLEADFNNIVRGGIRGAVVAKKVLLTLGPSQP